MKLSTLYALVYAGLTSAFVPSATNIFNGKSALSAENSRREVLQEVGWFGAMSFVVGGSPAIANAESRPTYLVEPTEEFKRNEEKAMEFKRQQLALKKRFNEILDRFLQEPDDEAALVKDLTDLRLLIVETGGLPSGLKKDDVYKQIRTKKARGFWPTDVEIA